MMRHRTTVIGRDPGAVKNRRTARAAAERLRGPEATDSGWFFMAPLGKMPGIGVSSKGIAATAGKHNNRRSASFEEENFLSFFVESCDLP